MKLVLRCWKPVPLDWLYLPIHYVFALSVKSHALPLEWKTHCINPIFKSGDQNLSSYFSSMYRLLDTLEKLYLTVCLTFYFPRFRTINLVLSPGDQLFSSCYYLSTIFKSAFRISPVSIQYTWIYIEGFWFCSSWMICYCWNWLNLVLLVLCGSGFGPTYPIVLKLIVRINSSCSTSLPVLSGVPLGHYLLTSMIWVHL